jgi:hypothetical protein
MPDSHLRNAGLSPAIKFNGNWYAYTVNDTIENF